MTVKITAKKPRRAPTLQQSATAPQATSRPAREIAPVADADEKRPVGRPPSAKGKGRPLNFNVDPEFATEYKAFAVANNLTMRELLEHSFAVYKREHG